ncbi:c-type cytochrome [Sulfurimonas sp.]
MMKIAILLFIIAAEIFANEALYNQGENLYFVKSCSSCHGPSAEGSSTYPRLANKKEDYIRKRLINFRAGKVRSVSAQMMSQFAKPLSDAEIKALSYFLSQHKKIHYENLSDDILGGFGS